MKGLKQNNQPSHDNPESHVFPISSLTFSHRWKTHTLLASLCSFQICYQFMLMLTHRIEANFTEIPLNICLVVVREEYIREGSSTSISLIILSHSSIPFSITHASEVIVECVARLNCYYDILLVSCV